MAKYNVIVADPCWNFSDKLTMSSTKRGAQSQYSVLLDQDIIDLDIKSIAADDAILVLWVPSSKLQVGMDTMKAWGFDQKQTFIWVKTKKPENIFKSVKSQLLKDIRARILDKKAKILSPGLLDTFDLNQVLSFFMGRLFRQTHEIALVGVRGKIYTHLENKSQRSVMFGENIKHSAKPEELQDRLDLMFPTASKIELFARRDRDGWLCLGDECPSSLGEDIRDSIERLKAI
jgi:N6-adenosine-specific RNA methylase IME4